MHIYTKFICILTEDTEGGKQSSQSKEWMCASEICVNSSAYIYLVDEWGRSETGQQPETLCPVELAWGWALDS